jgi:hypothetical protein
MTIRTNTPSLLDNPPVPVQAKLAAAWTSLMFFVIYIDYFHLYKPGAIDQIRDGGILVSHSDHRHAGRHRRVPWTGGD